MSEVVTECTCGQLPALEPRRMYALTDVQGTAMAESAVCGACAMTAAGEQVMSEAARADDYSGRGAVDCTGNDALVCLVCGWDGETEFAQRGCEACGAEPGEACRPDCIGQAAHLDELGIDVTEDGPGTCGHAHGWGQCPVGQSDTDCAVQSCDPDAPCTDEIACDAHH